MRTGVFTAVPMVSFGSSVVSVPHWTCDASPDGCASPAPSFWQTAAAPVPMHE